MAKSQKLKGFTLVELLVIVGILIILAVIVIPNLRFFQKESDLNNAKEEIINTLRLAQNKTLASEGDSQYGVYFDATSTPNQYTLFKGRDFVSRATSSDKIYKLPKTIKISEIDLWGRTEVVFERVTGYASTTDQLGKITLELKMDPSKTSTIYIENFGQVGLTSSPAPSDENRIKDSRHVHLYYGGREIATSTEKLILTFEGPVIEEIIIGDNVKEGQIDWKGTVLVGGDSQVLHIHTHRLNDYDTPSPCPYLPCTIFSIQRDRRYNNKALDIDVGGVPGDPAEPPDLIRYAANGSTTQGNSDYVSQPFWQ
jgi:type II secretory pathway pseudopilin PulG